MKELSIKQKAKRYDEALERAKKIENGEPIDVPDGTHIPLVIFPELYELEYDRIKKEDERVRQELIDAVQGLWENDKLPMPLFSSRVDAWMAWLIKQGKPDEARAKMFLINKGYPIDTNGVFPTYKEMYNIIREGLEQQSEKNHADKVEPKFKVGDWVVLTVGELSATLQIANIDINKELYWFNDGCILPFADEEYMHLWTIKDANAGDVLYYNDDTIVIFKCFHDDSSFCSYCYIDGGVFFTSNDRTPVWWMNNVFYPATKEQCNTLFAKMEESGYEWDSNKKELVKQMTDEDHKQYMLEHQDETIYDMSFEEAQDFISKRGFDIPWNDGDVMVDERKLTQTVANVLKWADRHPLMLPYKKK